VLHLLACHFLTVHFQHAQASLADAAYPGGQAGQAFAFVVEVEDEGMLARRERLRRLPADSLQVNQVPQEDGLSFEQVKAVATESASFGHEHPLGATLRNLDLRRDRVRLIEDAWSVAVLDSGYFTVIGEHRLARGETGSGGN
jgi:hypothetical protein